MSSLERDMYRTQMDIAFHLHLLTYRYVVIGM